ncbi:ABC transporter permease [Tenuifilum thalassicum]|uniref:ABC transporter permease n=1 Tax=Tenuifilum thalassicum TaxID=2590900 RepID=A0A7D4BSM8_9BACT|nr:FtsX-like permease family protein [Tenuifilum thalassicum]QKG80541.1 ABC transporter permease [Tenuifilum thalassicum]
MLLSLSWRNIWRNKTRSMVVVAAIAIGLWSGVSTMALLNGWIKGRMNDSINNEISHIQIHQPDFLLNEEVDKVFAADSVKNILDKAPNVTGYSQRIKLYAMAQSDRASAGLMVLGVKPRDERKISGIPQTIIMGNFLEGNHRVPSIVIGKKAAEQLKLVNFVLNEKSVSSLAVLDESIPKHLEPLNGKRYRNRATLIRDLKKNLPHKTFEKWADRIADSLATFRLRGPVILTFQTAGGELKSAMFRVRGIYKTSNTAFDSRMAFVDYNVLSGNARIPNGYVHEIAIKCTDNDVAKSLSKELSSTLKNLKIQNWEEISPEIALYAAFGDFMGLIYVVIFLFALAFGIINTMMMSVLERFREFGMLMAIGMKKLQIFKMIMAETVLLTLTGGVVGLALSFIFIKILSHTGVDLSMWAEGLEAIGYASVIYPELTVTNYILVTVLVIITGILSSIWPARRALKLNPMEALRIE